MGNKKIIVTQSRVISLIITTVILGQLVSGCSKGFKQDTITRQKSTIVSNNSEGVQEEESNVSSSVVEQPAEVINTFENNGNPIKLVIRYTSSDTSNYIKIDQTIEVTNTEESLIIFLKNKDLLSYQDSRNLNQPQMVITTKPSSCQVISKNPISEPNSFNCAIELFPSLDKAVDVSIEKIYDKDAKQILTKPITFKLKLKDGVH